MLFFLIASLLAGSDQTPTRSISIWSEYPIALEIEWLTIDETGKQAVTARRKTAVGPPVPLEFTHAGDRFVRFSYQGAAPRTYSTAELMAAKKLHVPDVLPGGELLLLVPAMTVRPTQLLIEGPRVKTVVLDSAIHASLSGLPGGDYRVVPLYEGGLKGAVMRTTVRSAETTISAMAAEPVGAVRVRAVDEVCGAATDLSISALVPDGGAGVKPRPNRVLSSNAPRCDMTFAGLKPGRFEAQYRNRGNSTGRGEFEVAPQTLSVVEVAAGRVRVEGRVTVNGRPMTDAFLTFLSTGPGPASMQALGVTDASGFYSIMLEEAGRYGVVLRRESFHDATPRQTSFVEGRNVYDIALIGGTIRILLTGWDQRSSVQVRIERKVDGRTNATVSTFGGPMKMPITYEALAFGDYNVSVAFGADRMRQTPANIKTVILTPSSPEVTVTFDVTRR